MQEKQDLWVVSPKVNKFVWKTGEEMKVDLNVRNLSDSALYFSRAEIIPSWIKGKKGIKIVEGNYLASGDSTFIAEFNLQLPPTPGLYTLKFGLETWIYNNYTTNWKNLGVQQTPYWGYIQVTQQSPIYTVFVSCSLREEDKPCVNQILNLLKLWGFNPVTVGINRFSEDPSKIPQDIDKEIEKATAVIGIATPRDYSIQDKAYKAFPWLHIETKKGIDSNKPLLFIVDERIKQEGLLEYPDFPKVFYNPTKLDVLEHKLAVVMPGFRELIAEKKVQKFLDGLGKAGLILGGIWLVGKCIEGKK
ncbi:MAG: hypothetical protein QME49_03205 [bacterium]|nr:hypothetical protein [bacterium]